MANNIPRPEHPRPDCRRDRWLNLNGEWQFEFDHARTGTQRGLFEAGRRLNTSINVPFAPESPLSGVGDTDFHECVWYKRNFKVPAGWRDGRVLLNFGAADYASFVWVNGKRPRKADRTENQHSVGCADTINLQPDHTGGYTPFRLDVTPLLKDGANELCMMALDFTRSQTQPCGKQSLVRASSGCTYTRTTGIWQTVWLECAGDTYVDDLRICPDPATGEVGILISLGGALQTVGVEATVSFRGQRVAAASGSVHAPAGHLMLKVPEPRMWDIGKGVLYDLAVTLKRGTTTLDTLDSYFGFRDFHIEGSKCILNGRPLFLRTVLDQGFYPDGICTAPTEEALRKDIELSMALGFDGARLHQKVFEPLFLYHADKLGYMVWGEYPSWGLDVRRTDALLRFLPEWLEAVRRDRNHPSVIGWCPFNETPRDQAPEVIQAVYEATKLVDPERPVIDTSGYVHVKTDVYDEHHYTQDAAQLRDDMAQRAKPGGRQSEYRGSGIPYDGSSPYYLSEYGGIWWSERPAGKDGWGYGTRPKTKHEFIERYRNLTLAVLESPAIGGFCYTQLYDIEQEQNGLLTCERKPKADPAVFRKINQTRAAIEDPVPAGTPVARKTARVGRKSARPGK